MIGVPHHLLVSYDIADDDRRHDISDLLAGHGARVQYSVFEITVRTQREAQHLRAQLRQLIDRDEDQIRIYPPAVERPERTPDPGQPPTRGTSQLLDRLTRRAPYSAPSEKAPTA